MLSDLSFYLTAVPAVILYGFSKGGFAGASLLAMPLMSLVMSPVTAAAILLPVLLVQDLVTVAAFRKSWDGTMLAHMLPGAVVGIGLGSVTAALITADQIRIAVGLLAIAFCLKAWWARRAARPTAQPHNILAATGLATLSGYSSFVIHSGGVPYNMYAIPRSPSPEVFAGTSGLYFALVNVMKVPAYFVLGQFTVENLWLSVVLCPIAILGNLAGIWLVRRVPVAAFFRLIYTLTFVVGLKLVSDGVWSLLASR
jgi:uncharacterized protein